MTSTPQPLKVAVMGAGAVGMYFGGMLARAGHDVTLIARPQHVEAVERDGLRMDTKTFDERVRVRASSDPAAVKGAQLVLFCVKSLDTESAGEQIKPFVGKESVVLCLQNGVDNDVRLRTVLTQPEVAAAVVYVGAEVAGPGHVKHHGRGDLVIDPVRNIPDLALAFVVAGVPTEVSPNVRGALWHKLIINCALNAVSAISQKTYGEAVPGVGIADVMRDVVDECLAIAKAEGVTIDRDVDAAIQGVFKAIPNQYASTAQDIMRGKPTEIDYLNGYIVQRGKALGIRTPANQALWALVKLIEPKK